MPNNSLRLLKLYLIACGLLLHVGCIVAFFFALNYYALSPRQFFIKLAEKAGYKDSLVTRVLEPPAQFTHHKFDGNIKSSRPRIILPELSEWQGQGQSQFMGTRFATYPQKGIKAPPVPCKNNRAMLPIISCWLAFGSEDKATQGIEMLLNSKVETPDAMARYGNGWQLALAFDLFSLSTKFSNESKAIVEQKIENALIEYLRVLDEGSASLWHGRVTLASNAWLCAIVLDPDSDKRRNLIKRAQGHFLDATQAIAMTEAWPGGYNYWINTRAFTFVLAAASYINGLENSQLRSSMIELLERIGLWTIHATRPDNRIEGYADEGPRIDLKDETQRVMDLIASLTGNPLFASYSHYLSRLHGREGYYRDYRWGFHLFNNPSLLPSNSTGALVDFEGIVPPVAFFGRNYSNKLYIRSSWNPDATFISYSAGHSFSHHGHYDAGHFTLFKNAPLAVNGSNYGHFTDDNRLNYSIRTIAKNSLLVQKPNEKVRPNRFFKQNVSDGGQRITLPTGSAITSVADWKSKSDKQPYLRGAELENFVNDSEFSYIKSDLTAAYNNDHYDANDDGGKVNRVKRELFYLKTEDILLVRDQILSTSNNYRSKWLLHTSNKPQLANEVVLKGDKNNGILSSTNGSALIRNGRGFLRMETIWPQEPVVHLVGGEDYRFYVENDGDDSELNGTNHLAGASDSAWFDNPLWRIELFPKKQTKETNFLVALVPSVDSPSKTSIHPLAMSEKNDLAVQVGDTVVLFKKKYSQNISLEVPGNARKIYLIGYGREPEKSTVTKGAITAAHSYGNLFTFNLTRSDSAKQIDFQF